MKICGNCKETKEDSNFSFKNKESEILNSYCKQCNKEYNKIHYQNNKKYYLDKSKEYSKKSRQYIYDYLKNKSCEECGEKRIATLQFDHININSKYFSISSAARNTGINKLKEEIDKCRILCANCHAVHTAKQFGWYKDLE